MNLDNPPFLLGQCWVSRMEPELGVGVVTLIHFKQIELQFRDVVRCYAMANAPLKRIVFGIGDNICVSGAELRVDAVEDVDGLQVCRCGARVVRESEIVAVKGANAEVEAAFFSADFSTVEAGQLRAETLAMRYHVEHHPSKGWSGGRVQLIPHQISTSRAIVDAMPGRFWLADEVGLGKTITAGLALHYLCLMERVEHVLILVPDALIIQWFIELYRRFNLPFSMLNDYFTEAVPPEDFWETHKFCLTSVDFVAQSETLQASLLSAEWDLVILDEAHNTDKNAQLYDDFYIPLIEKAESCFFLSAGVDALPADMLGDNTRTFRNTRAQIPLFPKREPHLVALESSSEDPKIEWLICFLREHRQDKILLIIHTQEDALSLSRTLRQKASLKTAMFHEGMTLVQRDKMAAYFADSEEAQLLICSEIGSEGRNFQFCHHLVMYDIPLSLDLLEQRIGRIDRIGQTKTIHVYMPFVVGTPQAAIVRWLDEAVGLFSAPGRLGDTFLAMYKERLEDVSRHGDELALTALITETIQAKKVTLAQAPVLDCRPVAVASGLLASIHCSDQSVRFEVWLESFLEHYNVDIETIASRTWVLHHGHSLFDALPDADALSHPFTFSREKALIREDYHFLSADHPLVANAFAMLLSSHEGICSAGYWTDKSLSRPTLYLVAIFVSEYGFPMRVVVDERGHVKRIPLTMLNKQVKEGPMEMFRNLVKKQKPLLETLLKKSRQEAQRRLARGGRDGVLRLDMVMLVVRG